jgi:hypothetical protein
MGSAEATPVPRIVVVDSNMVWKAGSIVLVVPLKPWAQWAYHEEVRGRCKYINVLTSMTSLTVGRRTGRVPVCDTCVRVVIHIAVPRDSDSRRQRRL